MSARPLRPALATALAAAVLLPACAMAPPPTAAIEVNGLEFENRSRSTVSSVTLMVAATGAFVSCGNIPPAGRCATRFPERVLSGNPVELSWRQSGQDWSTGAMGLDISQEVQAAGVAQVRVVIMAPGSAGVVLVPAGRPGEL